MDEAEKSFRVLAQVVSGKGKDRVVGSVADNNSAEFPL